MTERVGFECTLNRNTATYGSPTWAPINLTQNATLNLTKSEISMDRRGSEWKNYRGGLKDLSIDGEAIWDGSDAGLTAIKDSYFDGTAIDILALDAAESVVGAQGIRAKMECMSFTRDEQLEEGVKVSFTLKPVKNADSDPVWYEVES